MPKIRIHKPLRTRLTKGMHRRRLEKSCRARQVKRFNRYRAEQMDLLK